MLQLHLVPPWTRVGPRAGRGVISESWLCCHLHSWDGTPGSRLLSARKVSVREARTRNKTERRCSKAPGRNPILHHTETASAISSSHPDGPQNSREGR
jgi:hypothetical protein